MLKKRGAEIRKFLDAQDAIKSLYKENESLKANVEDWQAYSGSLQDKIETIKADLKPSEQYTKIQEKAELLQHKLNEQEKLVKDLVARNSGFTQENADLKNRNHNQEEKIQSLKDVNDKLQHKLSEWEVWWGTLVGDKSDLLQNLAEEVGVSQGEILKDLIEYGLAHTGEIYIEDLEVQ
jgi:chromosome segregation ATPase